jgi:hypothetical protein
VRSVAVTEHVEATLEVVVFLDLLFLLGGGSLGLGSSSSDGGSGGGSGGGTTGGHRGELAAAVSNHLVNLLALELVNHHFHVLFVGGDAGVLKELGDLVLS